MSPISSQSLNGANLTLAMFFVSFGTIRNSRDISSFGWISMLRETLWPQIGANKTLSCYIGRVQHIEESRHIWHISCCSETTRHPFINSCSFKLLFMMKKTPKESKVTSTTTKCKIQQVAQKAQSGYDMLLVEIQCNTSTTCHLGPDSLNNKFFVVVSLLACSWKKTEEEFF